MRQRRLQQILDAVAESGHITVAEVCALLGTSSATARRDLDTLAEQRLVMRTHGGATALTSGYELPLRDKALIRPGPKAAVARAAAALVAVGDVVGLNGGTTTTEVARQLGRSDHLAPADGSHGFTIVTSALNIAYELAARPHARIVLTGGTVRPRSYELVGPMAAGSIGELVLDLAVLGVDGVSARFGTTTADDSEAAVGRALAHAAKRVVVVADAVKLGATGPARLLTLESVDVLVTDEAPRGELAGALADAGVEVVVAGSP